MKKIFLLVLLFSSFYACQNNEPIILNNNFEVSNNIPAHSLVMLLHLHQTELYKEWHKLTTENAGKFLEELYLPAKSYCVKINDSCIYNNLNPDYYDKKVTGKDVFNFTNQLFFIDNKPSSLFFILVDKEYGRKKPITIQVKHTILSIDEVIEEHISDYSSLHTMENYNPDTYDKNGEHLCNIYRITSKMEYCMTFIDKKKEIRKSVVTKGELWTPYKFSVDTSFSKLVNSKPPLEQKTMYPDRFVSM